MKTNKVSEQVTGFLFREKAAMGSLYVCALVLVLGLMSGTSLAQESRATLEGRVTDPHGGVIPKASIEVMSEETGLRQKATSNADGLWSVRFLTPGTYQVTITAQGFKTAEQKGITLEVADDKRIETAMSVGATHEVVSVTAEAPLIDTSSATAGTVIEGATISELPMESRIAYLLASLSPGVHLIPQSNNVPFMWSYAAASDVVVNGGRDHRSNEFLLDGMPNQHGDSVSFIPSADSVAEFRVMTNAYDAQYGRQAGATFNVGLKSGSDAYHGSIYEHYENASFNANRYEFNHAIPKIPRPVAHYNLYGGTFGGPVIFDRKKTFFFVSWEGIRNKDPRNNSPLSLPTLAERNGDFRNSFTTTLNAGVRSAPIPINIYDPNTLSGNTRQQFVASSNPSDPRYNPACLAPALTCPNVMPLARLDPIAMSILKFVPLPNNPNDGTSSSNGDYIPKAFRQNKMASTVVRLDHTFNDRNKTYATLRWNHEDEFTDDFFHNLGTGSFATRINWGGGIDHVWVISPTQIFDVRYNVTRFQEPTRPQGSGFDPAQLGFSQSFVGQMPEKSFPRITGVFSDRIGGGFGSYFDTTYHTWMASMTHTQGNMTWHYGGDFRVIQEAGGNFGNQSGAFRFTGDWTRKVYNASSGNGDGSSMASFLLGLLSNSATNQPSEINRNATRFDSQHFHSLFFQNDWRVLPRLTLNMGLRWEYETPFTERFNRFTSVFDPTQLNPISDAAQAAYTNILNTMLANPDPRVHSAALTLSQLVPASSYKIYGVQLFPGVNGQKRTVTNLDLHEWQPRAGFAFQLFKSTVIRGGVGRFVQSTAIKGGQNGFSRTTGVFSSLDNGKTPYDTLDNPFSNGILAPTGSSLGPLTNLGQGVDWENQDPRRPYSWQYSFQIQHQLKSWLIEAGYSHQNTYDIQSTPGGLEQNDIGLLNWLTYNTPVFNATGQPQFGPGGVDIGAYHLGNSFLATRIPNPFQGLSTNGVACNVNPLPPTCVGGGRGTSNQISVYDLMRPLKLLGGQSMNDNPKGSTHYDALETKLQRRFANGYSFLASYTYSKLIEITSFLGPQLAGVQEHKIGGQDAPHKLSIASIYELPIGRDRKLFRKMPRALDTFIGGWEVTGQYTFESGPPVVFGTDSFFDGKRPVLHGKDPSLSEWFDTTHFFKFPGSGDDISQWPSWTGVQNLPGGNCVPTAAKNCVYADFANFIRTYPTRWTDVRLSRIDETNLGIYKNFRITERWRAQLRGEVFNLFNHSRFNGPNTNPGSSQFGIVAPAQVNEPRVLQFAFKITF
ncbi:MAG TPA: carboxypeptidase-like regulatory domain-containing protein [Terriglobales bacterium]|jgi:hypothetical protein|nr:carboxypeptidase-like regulatory domain-containing protein [Terriglobales bacterium]